MKISYKHLIKNIKSKPSIEEVSNKLFQLGHEHEINEEIFDMEFTPNRGDCLSVNGLLRDLAVFYDVNINSEIYDQKIDNFEIDFTNNASSECPAISFLKIELENLDIEPYKNELQDFYNDLDINQNNFFTDVSNYISYETGQPTHCYDAKKINSNLSLNVIKGTHNFVTLLDKKINLVGNNLVFLCESEVVNLAGIIGGKNSSCSEKTLSVIVECAHFNPEAIIGKSLKYNINSEAAHKFERNTDPECHEFVLRRFLKIIQEHTKIKNVELCSYNYMNHEPTSIPFNTDIIHKIIGIEISNEEYRKYLLKLGFVLKDKQIIVPSFRNDIRTQNDLAEEIARLIGYDNIPSIEFNINNTINKIKLNSEYKLKKLLIDNGFYEVINNPFAIEGSEGAITIDNPLDSNKPVLRTDLKNSLVKNLLFNERRQKDSIKLFEISDVYYKQKEITKKRIIGIIVSGRVGKNYIDFSKKLNDAYLISLLANFFPKDKMKFNNISRSSINSKLKTQVSYLEIEINNLSSNIEKYKRPSSFPRTFKKYKPISEYPSSSRDLSFSIQDYSQSKVLENLILNYKNDLLKDCYLFDYYKNDKMKVIKVGYRFIFQSQFKTLTDEDVDNLIGDIISVSLKINSVTLPGYKN